MMIIVDGVNGYGVDIVPGRPIAEFEIKQAGDYEIYLQKLPKNAEAEYELFIVPDYSSRNLTILFLSCFAHLAIIGLVGRKIHYRRNKERIQRETLVKDKKRAKFEEWMEKQKR